jgi:hypothetical protein
MNKLQLLAGATAGDPPKPPYAALPTGDDRILEISSSIVSCNSTASFGAKWEVNGVPQTVLPHPPADYVWH